jgi:hypothetical protein
LLVAEDDAEHDGAPLPVKPPRHRVRERPAEAITDAVEAAAPTDHSHAVRLQDDVDAVAAKPRALVESVARATRQLCLCTNLEDGSLRRRPPERQLELRRLVEPPHAEAAHAHGHLEVEPSAARRRRHDDEPTLGAADVAEKRALIQALEPCAAPPAAGNCEQTRERACGSG